MAYFIMVRDIRFQILKPIEKRCICDVDYYTLIENPITLILKGEKDSAVFKTPTNEAYSNRKYQSRAISFKGCIWKLDKISESYSILSPKRNDSCTDIDPCHAIPFGNHTLFKLPLFL
ncbi:hypothetical protein AT265_09185 [Bacillus cereus]|nr:hypothetical protein AT265_09185 [Bacillus cereus]PEE29881.1 hypothetical protein CON98_11895 [Bacillus toyonensis]